MRLITSSALAAGLLSITMLAGCGDPATTEEPAADATEEAAPDPQDGAAEAHDGYPPVVMDALMKASACRDIAEEANEVGMAAVQDQWDEAGCETLGDDLAAARAAHPDDEEINAALDEASRPIEE